MAGRSARGDRPASLTGLRHRPGAVELFDHERLFEFRKGVWKRHPHLAHHVSKMRTQNTEMAKFYNPRKKMKPPPKVVSI